MKLSYFQQWTVTKSSPSLLWLEVFLVTKLIGSCWEIPQTSFLPTYFLSFSYELIWEKGYRKRWKYLEWEGGKTEVVGVRKKRLDFQAGVEDIGFLVIRPTQPPLSALLIHQGSPHASFTAPLFISPWGAHNQMPFCTVAAHLLITDYHLTDRSGMGKFSKEARRFFLS